MFTFSKDFQCGQRTTNSLPCQTKTHQQLQVDIEGGVPNFELEANVSRTSRAFKDPKQALAPR